MKIKFTISMLIGIMAALVGLILLIIREDITVGLNIENPIVISFVSAIFFIYGIGFLLFSYLQYNRTVYYQYNSDSDFRSIKDELELLKIELFNYRNVNFQPYFNEEEVSARIKQLINSNLDNEQFLKLIESKFASHIVDDQKINRINRDFEGINQRIGYEINRLSKSANVNLVFGSLSTLFAIGFLGYEVLFNPVSFTETIPLLSHYIPRITIVVFVEVFAFFFLKIYRTNLTEIKYFHNEKTNIDLKLIAIKSAISSKNETIIQMAIEELAKTERNFVLRKGESTIEIEKEIIDAKNSKNLINVLKDILKSK